MRTGQDDDPSGYVGATYIVVHSGCLPCFNASSVRLKRLVNVGVTVVSQVRFSDTIIHNHEARTRGHRWSPNYL